MKLVCASANPDKVAEMTELLAGTHVELLPRPPGAPDVVEDEDTLEGNARLKAAAIATGAKQPAVAEDTGLFVDALDGRPGVFAARYAGEHATYAENRAMLLAELAERPERPRTATFRTVVMVVWPGGRELIVEGVCAGTIALVEAGDGGFGYDPLFLIPEWHRTFGELSATVKHALSHRGRALTRLRPFLRELPA